MAISALTFTCSAIKRMTFLTTLLQNMDGMKHVFLLLLLAPLFVFGQTPDEIKKKIEATEFAAAEALATVRYCVV